MGKIEILECDICHLQQKQNSDIHWTCRFSGPGMLDFSRVAHNQNKRTVEVICPKCSTALVEAFDLRVEQLKVEGAKS